MAIHDDSNSVKLPIPSNALAYGKRISEPYDDHQVRQRVLYNAIAVVILHNFFEILGVKTRYEDSDLSNPALQLAADSSTLSYSTLGLLECRGLPHDDKVFPVPRETWRDRLGYVFVGIDPQSRTATIHGFLSQVINDEIHIQSLDNVEAMVHHLHLIEQAEQTTERTCLSQWLEGIFQPGWETLEALILNRSSHLGYAFRGLGGATIEEIHNKPELTDGEMASRAKVLHWDAQDARLNSSDLQQVHRPDPVVLVVKIYQHDPVIAHVLIQMHPFHTAQCLPPNMTLAILDNQNKSILEATSRPIDSYLHFPFKAKAGEDFRVKITLDEFEINEYFRI